MPPTMLTIGTGPGPKNVLVEQDDGTKVVVTYRTWKSMRRNVAEQSKKYRTFTGIVQFDPREGEAGGKKVRNVTIRQAGVKDQAVNVSLTLWPSHAGVKVAKGDVVIADGVFTTNTTTSNEGVTRTYFNLSVSAIAVLGKANYGERPDVENETPDAGDDDIPY